MILDANLAFSSAQSLITNASTASTNVLDLATGVCTSSASYPITPNLTFGTATVFGEDLGIGSGIVPKFSISLLTTFLTASAATLNVAIQGAVDNGGGTIAGLTWTTYDETGPIAAAQLLLNTSIRMWWPHRIVGAALPRFIRLLYQLPAATSFTAGSINLAILTLTRDDWSAGAYPANYTVGA